MAISIVKRKVKYFLIPVVTFICACAIFDYSIYSFTKTELFSPNNVECRVYSISSVEQGVISVNADSLKFDGKKIDSNLNLLIYDKTGLFNDIEIGSVIKFEPKQVYKTDLFYYSEIPNTKQFKENIKYTLTTDITSIKLIDKDVSFIEKLKLEIKNNLRGGLTNENVELAYSTLFGDKDFLGDEQYKSYRLSGIAHLLAVSGLHVSIIVGILTFLCSVLRINGWAKFILIGILLSLYAIMCDFSVSVVRAGIMSLIALLSVLIGKEYDPLSAIGFAGIVAFVLNPLSIFDISFLMSFACAFGIVLFMKPISQALQKIVVNKKVADAMAVTISTLVALIMISAFFFKNFNFISLIANLILIPIFTVAFSIVFVVAMLSMIIPHIGYVLLPLNYIFDLINVLASLLGGFWFANLSTTGINFLAVPLYFLLLFMISRICVATNQNKIIFSLPTVAILLLCLI